MDAMQSIRKLGFRKWYERTLLRCHGNLVLLLLAMLGLLIGAEAYSHELPVSSQLTLLACAVASAVIGYWALRGYFKLMREAEFAADQAVCSQCETYGRWDITSEDRTHKTMQVRCRKCGHPWQIALLSTDATP
jgi:hypothetical protein